MNRFGVLGLVVVPPILAYLAPSQGKLVRWRNSLMLAYVLGIIALSISGRFYSQYYLGIIPFTSLLLAVALSGFTSDSVRIGYAYGKGLAILGVMLLSIPSYPYLPMLRNDMSTLRNLPRTAKYEEIDQEFDPYLTPLANQKGQFYSFGEPGRLHLNVHYNITTPTKWVYIHFWNISPSFDPDGQIFASLISDIDRSQTRLILDYSVLRPLVRADLQREWRDYVQSKYEQVAVMSDGSTLLRRRVQ